MVVVVRRRRRARQWWWSFYLLLLILLFWSRCYLPAALKAEESQPMVLSHSSPAWSLLLLGLYSYHVSDAVGHPQRKIPTTRRRAAVIEAESPFSIPLNAVKTLLHPVACSASRYDYYDRPRLLLPPPPLLAFVSNVPEKRRRRGILSGQKQSRPLPREVRQ